MNTFKKLALCAALVGMSISFATAAPNSTRHGKLLSVKQFVNAKGDVVTTASLVTPTAQSNGTGLVIVTNRFGAAPVAGDVTALFSTPAVAVPRFKYEDFWPAMLALQKCENAIAGVDTAGSLDPNSGEYSWYNRQKQPSSAKTLANMVMAGYPTAASSSLSECAAGGLPAPMLLAAAKTRESVANYNKDSPEALDFVTSKYWIGEKDSAKALKVEVVKYLQANEIEFAWVDVEFEYKHETAEPVDRRMSLSFQINYGDKFDDPATKTKGSYIGSQLVLPPDVDLSLISGTGRNNKIEIEYTAYSQYPDFGPGSGSIINTVQLKAATLAAGINRNGTLSWKVTPGPEPSTISPDICGGIPTTDGVACTPSEGRIILTSGTYDPNFKSVSSEEIVGGPYTIENKEPFDDESGIECFVKGTGSERCRLDRHNASTLMQYGGAGTGTLKYTGRWEAEFEGGGAKPKIEEMSRGGVFDVCYGVELQNSLRVYYWVRRPYWEVNLYWQNNAGIDYQVVSHKYIVENVELQRPANYSTYPLPENNYNLTGTGSNANVRSNANIATVTERPNNYAAIKAGSYDPPGLNLPDNEGAMIMNPLVTRLTSGGGLSNIIPENWMVYRELPGVSAVTTYAAHMIGSPIYKQGSYGASRALPGGWLGRGNTALARDAEFNCHDQNESVIVPYKNAEIAHQPMTVAWWGAPPDPFVPSTGSYPGTTTAHKKGTRPDATASGDPGDALVPDPCEISFVRWEDVKYTREPMIGPLPDSRFVPPASCTPPDPVDPKWVSPPASVCVAPLNEYRKYITINEATKLTYTRGWDSCHEYCELAGPVKQCPRPWPRFN